MIIIIIIYLDLIHFILSFHIYFRWGHSLLYIIRQQHKSSSSSNNNVLDENNDIHKLTLSPDQAAHARACAK